MPMSIACHLRKHANQLGVGPGKKVRRSFLISDGLSSETPAHSAQDRRALDDLDRVATEECQVWVLAQDADRVVMGIGLDNRVRNLGVLELLDAVGGHSTLPEQWGTRIDQSRSMARAQADQAAMKSACCCSVSPTLSMSPAEPLRIARNLGTPTR